MSHACSGLTLVVDFTSTRSTPSRGARTEIGADANVLGRGCRFVDRGHTRRECLACHRDGVLVLEIVVVDQHAAGKPSSSEYADRISGIECESSYGVDRSGELRPETFEIESLVASQACKKARFRKRWDLSLIDHSRVDFIVTRHSPANRMATP